MEKWTVLLGFVVHNSYVAWNVCVYAVYVFGFECAVWFWVRMQEQLFIVVIVVVVYDYEKTVFQIAQYDCGMVNMRI